MIVSLKLQEQLNLQLRAPQSLNPSPLVYKWPDLSTDTYTVLLEDTDQHEGRLTLHIRDKTHWFKCLLPVEVLEDDKAKGMVKQMLENGLNSIKKKHIKS